MIKSDRNLSLLLFIFLLVVNAILRFYESGTFSLSNDELSAIYRSDFNNFTDLIQGGVIATDPHPAGVQIFLYYWTKVFSSVFAIRFPFILSGLLSLVFIFLLFKSWIGEQRALLAVTLYSLMQFTLIHGQLARPYAMGILFVSAFVWSWDKIVNEGKLKSISTIVFIVAGTLSCYVHYYAALVVGIVGLTGIFPAIKRGILLPYLLFGLVSILLFLPHISITMVQLSKGSLTSWIDPAGGDFITNHLFQLLNNSIVMLIGVSLLILLSFFSFIRSGESDLKPLIYSSIFFVSPVLVGYLYSHFIGSVLMDRVLYFSAPFFFVIPFMAIPKMKISLRIISFFLLLSLSLTSTFSSGVFFERLYVENFKELALDIKEATANDDNKVRSEEKEVVLVGNYNSPEYINFYSKNDPIHFNIWEIDSDKKLAVYMKLIRNASEDAMLLSWACKYQPIAAVEYGKMYYPNIVFEKSYYNSGIWYLNNRSNKRETVFNRKISKDKLIEEHVEYFDLLKLKTNGNYPEVINVSAEFISDDSKGILLVYSLTSEDGRVLEWRGHHFSDFEIVKGENQIFISFKMPPLQTVNNKIAIYIWNPEGKEIRLKDIVLNSFSDSHYPQLY